MRIFRISQLTGLDRVEILERLKGSRKREHRRYNKQNEQQQHTTIHTQQLGQQLNYISGANHETGVLLYVPSASTAKKNWAYFVLLRLIRGRYNNVVLDNYRTHS